MQFLADTDHQQNKYADPSKPQTLRPKKSDGVFSTNQIY